MISLSPTGCGELVPTPSASARTGAAFGPDLMRAVEAGMAASAPAETAAPSRTASVGMTLMLGLQESVTADAGDREARRHGQDLLAALVDLQRGLLSGEGGSGLHRLALLADLTTHVTDPALKRVIGSIKLRARLELARAGRGLDASRAGP